MKFTKEGKFRQFGFIGYKTEEDAQKAIQYFNNTFMDASKMVVESCMPLNDTDKQRAWSKYSKDSSAYLKINPEAKKAVEVKNAKTRKKELNELRKKQKDEKLESLIGPLKDDAEFKEFVAANKAIKSGDNLWHNDIHLDLNNNEADKAQPAEDVDSVEDTDKKELKLKSKKEPDSSTELDEAKEDKSTAKKDVKSESCEADFENGRLFVRNLCYTCKEDDLEKLFSSYGPLVETNMPIDTFSKRPKGFAYITCMFPEKALKAYAELDGTVFQGRMLHILPGKSKKEDEENTEDMTFKKKKEVEQKKKAQSSHNWNSLFINQDAVANLMASRYDVDKSQLFDVHSTGKKSTSIAVKLAVGETQIVNDMRKFLIRNGVKLEAFNAANTERSKNVILIKNLPNHTHEKDLRELFNKFELNESIQRLVVPEYGLCALIEFGERQDARNAFKKLAYRKFKNVPIYLEWAPVDVFEGDEEEQEKLRKEEEQEKQKQLLDADQELIKNDQMQKGRAAAEEAEQTTTESKSSNIKSKVSHQQQQEDADEEDYEANATLFVKNLSFDTDEDGLSLLFSKIGKCKTTVARKLSPKGESLSMGYGFVKFKKASHANEALKTLQNERLDGHNLELKFSNRVFASNTTNNSNKKSALNKQNKTKSSKLLIRNIPFEAKAREVEELFKVFGELKYVRLPKKIDGAHRGFGFVDFVTVNDAERAFESLSQSTHFFGRRLVLEWAEPEQSQDVEILRHREETLSGPVAKRLKKSKILSDLGGNDDFDGKMDHTT